MRLPGSSPSSRLAELRIARPPMCCSAGLEHRRLGGVEHERHARLGGEALGDLVHVDGAVAADVVDADVEHVGALADLLVGHLRAGVPVAGEHRVAERLRAVGVGALADDQQAEVLVERRPGCRSTTRSARTRASGAPARGRGPPRRPGGGARASCRSSRRRSTTPSSVTWRRWNSASCSGVRS